MFYFAHLVSDSGSVWRTAAVHIHENADVTMTPSEFAKTAPVLGASIAHSGDQQPGDLARSMEGAQRDTG